MPIANGCVETANVSTPDVVAMVDWIAEIVATNLIVQLKVSLF